MMYKGHKITLSNGYQEIYLPEHPLARKKGNIYVHILVAEDILGRHLTDSEVVHHIDGNRQNNDSRNLMVFASQTDHAFYHKCLLDNKLDYCLYKLDGVYHCVGIMSYDGKFEISTTKFYGAGHVCKYCGKVISNKAVMCEHCAHLHHRKVERPSRAVLKSQIRKLSFSKVAVMYGVSDNAIRKWCKQYNLPYKRSVIASLDGNQWDRI